MKELLELRKKQKQKKPDFIRQDAHKKVKVGKKWRKPRGLQSKVRLNKRGYRRAVSLGYRSPTLVRGLHKSGLKPVFVNSLGDLENVDKAKEGAIVAGSVGIRKRVDLLKKAKELGVKVLNVKNVDEYIKNVEDRLKSKKEVKKKVEAKKKEKVAEKEKKAEKLEAEKKDKGDELAEKVSEEDKQRKEKEEKDKILTQRE